MKSHARVVVIGGGAVGVSTLYHLAHKGWSDIVLVERAELTAGSTWHAAGLLPLFNMSYTVGQLHKYSIDLYKRLPAETGQDVSFHVTGNLRLATSRDRLDEYKKYCGTANTIGVPFEIIGPERVKELWPLLDLGGTADTAAVIGGLYHPHDGHIAPADLTMALRKGARAKGAEIHEQTEVTAVSRTRSGEWKLTTTKGEITAEHVVCATGNYARQTGKMFGLNVPAIPVEHQYIVYEESAELKAYRQGGGRELAVMREPDQSYYLREERMGWILGPYEAGAPARFADGVPSWFGKSLFDGDLERLIPHIEGAQRRVPALANCGIKDIVNGPISYTPDGSALIGPAWGLPNVWLNEGHSFGITAAGGAGWQLAEWIVEGEPGIDMLARRPAPLRPLHQQALPGAEERGDVSQRLHRALPGRGTPGCAPGEDEPGVREAEAHGRGVRPALRLGARQLVRARGHRSARRGASAARTISSTSARNAGVFASRWASSTSRRSPSTTCAGRAPRPGSIRWSRTRCRRRSGAWRSRTRSRSAAASAPSSRSRSSATSHFYLVSAGAAERYDADFLREAPAGRRGGGAVEHHDLARLLRARRPALARGAREAHRHAAGQRRVPVAHRPGRGSRARDGRVPAARQLRGCARLGAALPDRVREPPVRGALRRGRGIRHRHGRHARDGVAAHREVLPHVGQRPDAATTRRSRRASTASCA